MHGLVRHLSKSLITESGEYLRNSCIVLQPPCAGFLNSSAISRKSISWSVQQSRSGSRHAFPHSNSQNEMQIGAQMRRTVVPHLKPILNASKLKIEIQIEMKWYIFLSIHQLWHIFKTETKIEMRDWTVEHCRAPRDHGARVQADSLRRPEEQERGGGHPGGDAEPGTLFSDVPRFILVT